MNFSDEMPIPVAAPMMAAPIGPIGVSIAPMKPNWPISAAAPPNPIAPIAMFGKCFFMEEPILLFRIPPIFLPEPSSLPYKNSWNVLDFHAIPTAAPIKAPVIGPPGSKKLPMKPIGPPIAGMNAPIRPFVAPNVAPPSRATLCFVTQSITPLLMMPPIRFPSTPFSPNRNFLNFSD